MDGKQLLMMSHLNLLSFSAAGTWNQCLVDIGEDYRQKPHKRHERRLTDVRIAGAPDVSCGSTSVPHLILTLASSLKASSRGCEKRPDCGGAGAAGKRSQRARRRRKRYVDQRSEEVQAHTQTHQYLTCFKMLLFYLDLEEHSVHIV